MEAAGLLRYYPKFGAKIRKIVGTGVKIEGKMKKKLVREGKSCADLDIYISERLKEVLLPGAAIRKGERPEEELLFYST